MRARVIRALRRLLVLLPVLFLLVGCAAQGSGAESQSRRTEVTAGAESTQKEGAESRSAESKKKQKKSKKSKKSDKRQSEGAASTASETLSEAETSEALAGKAAGETRAAKKSASATRASERGTEAGNGIREDGSYTSRDEVALYLHTYGKLPKNFISKKEAEEQGFRFGEGDFGEAFPGMSVGGSRFGNYDGKLPDKSVTSTIRAAGEMPSVWSTRTTVSSFTPRITIRRLRSSISLLDRGEL